MSQRIRISVWLLVLTAAALAVPSLQAAPAPTVPRPQFLTNLLANPNADTGDLSGWHILENGGEGWMAQHGVFRTSYAWNRRQQLIDLWSRGFDADLMAKAPAIVISEEFQRQYCPDSFYLKVELLDANFQVVTAWDSGERINTGVCQWGGDVWERLTHTFRDYAPGVRYIRWEDGGKDREYWLGHYGVKMDNAEIVVLDDRHPAYWHNLLANPDGADGTLTGWEILESGGSGWTATAAGLDGGNAFQTSSGWSRRRQEIDLRTHGFTDDIMTRSPLIRVGQSFKGEGCPDEYYLKVDLLDAARQVLATFDTGLQTTSGTCTTAGSWDGQFHSFADYGPGVRYIRWEDGGRDTAGQSGHHGTKMAQPHLLLYTGNLLANPGAETGDFSGWQVTENGGAGWMVNNSGRDGRGTRTFATSWWWNRKVQVVDLLAHGYTAALLDQAPPIHVQEQFRRVYCPDDYYLKVDLLDAQGAVVTSWSTGILTNHGNCEWVEAWEEVYHIFQNYGPGVRYVRWEDGGKDREYWYSHYGPQMDAAYLAVHDTSEHARHQARFREMSTRFTCGPGTGVTCPCGDEDNVPCPAKTSCTKCFYANIWDKLIGHLTCYEDAGDPACHPSCDPGLHVIGNRCLAEPVIQCCEDLAMTGIQPGQGYAARVDLRWAHSVVPEADPSCVSPTVSKVRPIGRNSSGPLPWSDVYPELTLMFNANFYDVSGFDPYVNSCSRALGLTVSDGEIVTPAGNALGEATETLVFFPPLLGSHADIVPQPLTQPGLSGILNAVSGFRLLRGGTYVEQPLLISPNSLRPRTVVGLDRDKRHLIVVVVNTGQDSGAGAKLKDLADYLKYLGAVDALTLDGSGSAQLFYRDNSVTTLPSDLRPNQSNRFYRPVPVFLGFR